MPIKIPNDLPATQTLLGENIFAITETRAITQDIRPLEILVLNLMPTKIATETSSPVCSATLPCRSISSSCTPKPTNPSIPPPTI